MAEPALRAFVVVAWILSAIVVLLTRVSVPPGSSVRRRGESTEGASSSDALQLPSQETLDADGASGEIQTPDREESPSITDLSTDILLANAVLTHGSIIVVLVLTLVLTGVSWDRLGVEPGATGSVAVLTGLLAGILLSLGNEALSIGLKHLGYVPADLLRSALAPSSVRGWSILLFGILPLVSVAEELLFRSALIGATLGLGVSPILAVLSSSVLFAFAHGMQGSGGVMVAGALGLGLGLLFIWTESLLVVVIAHYVVNSLEFLVHEGLDWNG